MKYEIIWSKDAGNELLEIISYIKRNTGKTTAEKISTKILNEVKRASENARGMMVSPLLAEWGISHIYQLSVNPWIIYYRVENSRMVIVSIIDGRRNLEEILYEKMMKGKIS